MTQIERIRAEIERLKAEAFNKINHDAKRDMVTDVANSQRIAICEQLLDFINSIPTEPSEDLEKFIQDLIDKYPVNKESVPNDSLNDYYQGLRFGVLKVSNGMMKSAVDATCVLLPPPDVFKVLICHEATDKLAIGQKVKVIVKEDKQ